MNIIQKYTPHWSERKGWVPDMICCHQTSGSIQSCINWFANPESKVSAHFAVAKDGTVYQFVPIEKMAWCNGTKTDSTASNYYGKSPNSLIRARKTNANFYTVSIEFENQDTGVLTEAQYDAGLQLMMQIRSEVRRIYGTSIPIDRLHVIPHADCSPVNKATCPGKDFPFTRFLEDLNRFETEPPKKVETATEILRRFFLNVFKRGQKDL